MVSAFLSWMLCCIITIGKRGDEVRERIMRDEQANWRGGWGA